jgi:hypothetical protein
LFAGAMSKRTKNLSGYLRALFPALLWLGAAVLMWRNWQQDPYDPALTGTDAYGHNWQGALSQGLAFSLGELLVYYAITRPWRRESGSVLVPVLGLLLFGGWSLFQMVMLMHAGGIQGLHVLWLWALDLLLVFEILLATRAALHRAERAKLDAI